MKHLRVLFVLFLFVTFSQGLYLYASDHLVEQMTTATTPGTTTTSCYDVLLERDSRLFLINTKLPLNTPTNPLIFPTIHEYAAYSEDHPECGILQITRDDGSFPVMDIGRYLETGPNGSGNGGGKPITIRDASRDNGIFNQGSYPAFDPTSQYQGVYTTLDAKTTALGNPISDSPIDSNWGGTDYTQRKIELGIYKDKTVPTTNYQSLIPPSIVRS